MKYLKVYTISLGCPKNLVDTENMLGSLRKNYLPVSDPQKAEVILINTCAFIQEAVEESIETILEICESTKNLPHRPYIIVTGCMVSRYKDQLYKEIPEVDIFLPIGRQNEFPEIIERKFKIQIGEKGHSPLKSHNYI
jgi:tRNA A37 methylthiotransferase MiaB